MTNSRLYVIELKDAETGVSEFVTTVELDRQPKAGRSNFVQPTQC